MVEHLVYTENVGGSRPSPPTIFLLKSSNAISLHNIKEQLNIIPVDSIDQVIENALVHLPQELSVLDASKLVTGTETNITDEANISH